MPEHESGLPCGCDPGIAHLCMEHKMLARDNAIRNLLAKWEGLKWTPTMKACIEDLRVYYPWWNVDMPPKHK